MGVWLFGLIFLFITLLQAFIPYFLKQTIVFGVYVPEQYTRTEIVTRLKKRYAISVLLWGLLIFVAFLIWLFTQRPTEDVLALVSVGLQFAILFVSVGYYIVSHVRMKKVKAEHRWTEGKNEVRVVDLTFQDKVQLIPKVVFVMPMIVTIGLIIYTYMNYDKMPDLIPTHWGPSGEPDAFTGKNYFTVVLTMLILLVLQGMMLIMSEGLRFSGAKINPNQKKKSAEQQLRFRKYSSWLSLFISVGITLMLGYFHLQTIHPEVTSSVLMMGIPLTFLIGTLLVVIIFTWKVGQGGTRLKVEEDAENIDGNTISVDDDKYWKAGVIYINKDDPSILVEKRFGVGWSLNFAHPIGWLIFFGPLVLILILTLAL